MERRDTPENCLLNRLNTELVLVSKDRNISRLTLLPPEAMQQAVARGMAGRRRHPMIPDISADVGFFPPFDLRFWERHSFALSKFRNHCHIIQRQVRTNLGSSEGNIGITCYYPDGWLTTYTASLLCFRIDLPRECTVTHYKATSRYRNL